ncbi:MULTISPECIES: TonB family protein [unclassified Shewanella]|uniref:energy transducer TonB n=1 Tax=unclassified Shewanella TaxID=196818 RepID=UPI0035529FC5
MIKSNIIFKLQVQAQTQLHNQVNLVMQHMGNALVSEGGLLAPRQLIIKAGIMLLGAIVTLALFVFMAQLVKSDAVYVDEPAPLPVINFFQKPQEPQKVIKKIRVQPQKVPAIIDRTPMPTSSEGDADVIKGFTPEALPVPKENYDRSYNDGDAMPVVQVSPQYPMAAARDGKEGYVIVMFDISKTGEVINAQVMEAEPRRVFNRSAIQAINNWKYKPKTVAGQAIEQKGLQVRLDFSLDQAN